MASVATQRVAFTSIFSKQLFESICKSISWQDLYKYTMPVVQVV
jgi:hypothetical protein